MRSGRRQIVPLLLAGVVLIGGASCSDEERAPTPSSPTPAPATTQATGSAPSSSSATGSGSSRTAGPAPGTSSAGTKSTQSTPPPAPATTPVPPPTPGSVESTVPSRPVVTKPPVPIDKKVEVEGKVSTQILKVRAIKAKARLPGEISGDGVAITISVTNGSRQAVDVSSVVVNLEDSKGLPANQITSAPAKSFKGSVPAGRSRSAVYVFTVPKSDRSPVTVSVVLTGDSPVAVFKGPVK
jgi:hypothetical protein